ncbi:MAG: 4'-phosphopantetheinyl transferase superfamily protein [Verrucomicrobiota bacterium]
MQISFREWNDAALAQSAAATLSNDEVQVWTARGPADETALAKLTTVISPDQHDCAKRFATDESRREFVFGHAVLRQLLGACLKVEPATLVFGRQPHGKPFLLQPGIGRDLSFNLSHSGGMIAIALAWKRKVGVDIEFIHGLEEYWELAPRIFSTRELGELRSLHTPQQRAAFFNGWTRKEAYLKATGEGLTDALPAIEVTLAPGKEPELLDLPAGPKATRLWVIRAIPLPPGFVGAVVFENNSPSAPGFSRVAKQHDSIFTKGPSDVFDHATSEIASGSKMGFDATKKIPGEGFKRARPPCKSETSLCH